MVQGLQGKDGFHRTGAPQQVAQLALGGVDRQMIGGAAEAAPQCSGLRQVTEVGAGGMGLNAAEVCGAHLRPTQGIINGTAGLQPLRFGGDDVVGIAAAATGQQPAQVGPWRRVLLPHQGQDASAFGEHEAISTEAIGPGGLIGIVVAAGQGAHGGKTHQS